MLIIVSTCVITLLGAFTAHVGLATVSHPLTQVLVKVSFICHFIYQELFMCIIIIIQISMNAVKAVQVVIRYVGMRLEGITVHATLDIPY